MGKAVDGRLGSYVRRQVNSEILKRDASNNAVQRAYGNICQTLGGRARALEAIKDVGGRKAIRALEQAGVRVSRG